MTPTVTILPNLQLSNLGVLAMGTQANDDAQYLFLNPFDATTNSNLGIGTADLTTNPPSAGVTLATGSGASNFITGPDGCVYAAAGDGVFKITDTTGACNYAAPSQPPSLVLAPPTVSPNSGAGHVPNLHRQFPFHLRARGYAGHLPGERRQRPDQDGALRRQWPGFFQLYGDVSGCRHDCRISHSWDNQS